MGHRERGMWEARITLFSWKHVFLTSCSRQLHFLSNLTGSDGQSHLVFALGLELDVNGLFSWSQQWFSMPLRACLNVVFKLDISSNIPPRSSPLWRCKQELSVGAAWRFLSCWRWAGLRGGVVVDSRTIPLAFLGWICICQQLIEHNWTIGNFRQLHSP